MKYKEDFELTAYLEGKGFYYKDGIIFNEKWDSVKCKPQTFNEIMGDSISLMSNIIPPICIPVDEIVFKREEYNIDAFAWKNIGDFEYDYSDDGKVFRQRIVIRSAIDHIRFLAYCLDMGDNSEHVIADILLFFENFPLLNGWKIKRINDNRREYYRSDDFEIENLFGYGFGYRIVLIRPVKKKEIIVKKQKPVVKKQQVTYLMKDNSTGLYKIGRSINPKNREKTLQSEKPSIKMVWSNKEDFESELHERYKNQRVRGEWFNLTETQVKYIATHY